MESLSEYVLKNLFQINVRLLSLNTKGKESMMSASGKLGDLANRLVDPNNPKLFSRFSISGGKEILFVQFRILTAFHKKFKLLELLGTALKTSKYNRTFQPSPVPVNNLHVPSLT